MLLQDWLSPFRRAFVPQFETGYSASPAFMAAGHSHSAAVFQRRRRQDPRHARRREFHWRARNRLG